MHGGQDCIIEATGPTVVLHYHQLTTKMNGGQTGGGQSANCSGPRVTQQNHRRCTQPAYLVPHLQIGTKSKKVPNQSGTTALHVLHKLHLSHKLMMVSTAGITPSTISNLSISYTRRGEGGGLIQTKGVGASSNGRAPRRMYAATLIVDGEISEPCTSGAQAHGACAWGRAVRGTPLAEGVVFPE